MTIMLLADASPITMLIVSVVVGAISVGLAMAGRQAMTTKKVNARKLEKIWADENNQVHGSMAVVKGFIMFIGGIVLTLLCVALFLISIYILIFGPIVRH